MGVTRWDDCRWRCSRRSARPISCAAPPARPISGRTWLQAKADTIAAFTELQATWQPPPLPELDHILAHVLADRFSLPPPATAA
jgi:hypothetical protein